MANTAEKQEFWKPALASREYPAKTEPQAEACPHCSVPLLAGSVFCHKCGHPIEESPSAPPVPAWFNLASLLEFLGQTTASLVCLALGTISVIAAIITGFIYTASTLLDWQAVQIWRIEWLLAAAAFFVAGILLKKK
jgi:hypothetical protein